MDQTKGNCFKRFIMKRHGRRKNQKTKHAKILPFVTTTL